jgi:predicted PurR-regulated permease PerM
MLSEKNLKSMVIIALVLCLFVLAAIIIRPLAISIFLGALLGYMFYPIYFWFFKKTKRENLSAFIICIGVLSIVIMIFLLFIGSLTSQAVNLYLSFREANLNDIIQKITLNLFSSSQSSEMISNSLKSVTSNLIDHYLTGFNNFILNLPNIGLQFFVVFFVFFYSLRDGEKAIQYVKSLAPFEKDVQEKFFKKFEEVTYSVLYGQVVVGIIQGVLAGIGFFIFGVHNAILLTLISIIAGVIPFLGAWLVWVPVDIYLFLGGNTNAGIGLLIYGSTVVSLLDNLLRPILISRKTQINSAIIIVGMIGGLIVYGILGLIMGPLILAYVLLVLELYRKRAFGDGIIFKTT